MKLRYRSVSQQLAMKLQQAVKFINIKFNFEKLFSHTESAIFQEI